jgi:TonB family protein
MSPPVQRDVPTENYPASVLDSSSGAEPQPTVGYTPPPTDAGEERTVTQQPVQTVRPLAAKKRSGTLLWVLLAVGLAGVFIVVLGIAGVLYYMVYRQPEVARTNSNSVVLSNVNTTNSDSSLSNSNSIDLGPNGNSSSMSNTLTVPTTNINTAANRRATPSPTKTVETRITPSPEATPPPPPTPRPVPSTVSGGVLNGKAISLPKPAYPPAARAVRAGGSVNVQVLIDESGRVISAHAVSGNPLLTSAAESAARGARFSPTMLSGQPVKVSGVITYNFVP